MSKPAKNFVRDQANHQQRQQPKPQPPLKEIRRQLGWDLIEMQRSKRFR